MKRNLSIDIARGIGILLVVMGHSWFADTTANPEFREFLAAFRMPVFFFVSGLFLSVSSPPADFIKVRADALMKPYFVVLLAVWAVYAAKDLVTGSGGLPDIAYDLGRVFYGVGLVLTIPPLWFLPLLFLTTIATFFIARQIPAENPRRTAILLVIALLILMVGSATIETFWGLDRTPGVRRVPSLDALPGLPWSIDLLGISLPFMLAGFALREQAKALTFRPWLVLLAVAVLVGLRFAFDETMDLNMRRYDGFLIVTLQGIAGLYMVLGLSVWLTRFTVPRTILLYVSQGSLFILLFHYHIQRFVFARIEDHLPSPFLAATIAYLICVAIPLLMLEVTRRSPFLSALLLPLPRDRLAPRRGPSEPVRPVA